MLVRFSSIINKTFPAVITSSLSGSDFHALAPGVNMQTEKEENDTGRRNFTSMTKITRKLVFQLFEVLAVLMLLYDLAFVISFLQIMVVGAMEVFRPKCERLKLHSGAPDCFRCYIT
ncbi:LOW QUALITY PROTEIN: Hypothetical protein PHPALM_371 [Phytophthora palmivora]|uniref:Uncharacterized protein n=1 Tax=Phytophthora palmivora TaxID=4796 RepID=A0A2P4YUY9_9STRA|nr:LOW QUALITY PROTEIN: Hypothetical protein PHPALM_371 [Phytophthora palmivora]